MSAWGISVGAGVGSMRIEGRGLRPSAIAIAAAGPDPVMAKAIEIGACPLAERFHYLNGIDRPG